MKCTGKNISLLFLHRNNFFHWVSLPGIPVPVSEFPVHVPVQNKYARIPVPASYPGTGSAQPLIDIKDPLKINLFRNYSIQASLGVDVRWKRLLRCFDIWPKKTNKQRNTAFLANNLGIEFEIKLDATWSKFFSSTKTSLQGWEELEEKSKRLAKEVEQLEAEVICHL